MTPSIGTCPACRCSFELPAPEPDAVEALAKVIMAEAKKYPLGTDLEQGCRWIAEAALAHLAQQPPEGTTAADDRFLVAMQPRLESMSDAELKERTKATRDILRSAQQPPAGGEGTYTLSENEVLLRSEVARLTAEVERLDKVGDGYRAWINRCAETLGGLSPEEYRDAAEARATRLSTALREEHRASMTDQAWALHYCDVCSLLAEAPDG